MTVSDFASATAATCKGIVKMLLMSRGGTLQPEVRRRPLAVLGNGPSLNRTLADDREALGAYDLMAVNFAANAPVFESLRPRYYVLADPFFFSDGTSENLLKLRRAMSAVDWPMTLLVPRAAAARARDLYGTNTNITVRAFNAVGVEGFGWFERAAYGSRMAMPRPRNVLIPAIMCGIWLGYTRINIVGADHSWMQSLYVDDRNHVVSVQPHFYSDSESERARVYAEYEGYRLHDIIRSFYVAFRAYHRIAAYARGLDVRIVNSTPGSYIDAFERGPL